jgi:formate dehydrogenase subunit gamma
MATDRAARRHAAVEAGPAHVVRYRRPARLFHTATYLVTFVLLATGWWLRTGHEGRPSTLARWTGVADVELHRRAGWALAGLLAVGVTLGARATATFARETVRVDRGDGAWFRRWPAGARGGRFAHHRGHFDPGQRLANVAFVLAFGTLVVTGVGLTTVHGGPQVVLLARWHRIATYALTGIVAGHVVLALGLLPGYRGVWHSMHLGGRVPVATARRLWPGTVDAQPDADRPTGTQAGAAADHPEPVGADG